MDNLDDLRLLLASRHPLVVAEMHDEVRFMNLLRPAAAALQIPVWTWSVTRGLAAEGNPPQYNTTDPKKALALIADLPPPAAFVLADAQKCLEDPVVLRQLKELAQNPAPGKTIIVTMPQRSLPAELEGLALPWKLKPPEREEVKALVGRTIEDLKARRFQVTLTGPDVEALVDAVKGLSLPEAERLIQQAALRDGGMNGEDVAFVRRAKAELLEAEGILELVEADLGGFGEVGGLENLKGWLALRGRAMEPEAAAFGLDPPKGVLVTGVPGCGKSLVAKTLASAWGLPLVLLDPGRLYGPYIGESERRLDDALRTVEAMAPAVLWIDEIEKGFASGGTADSGVSKRILGTFLRWMQDRPAGVFLIATANDVAALPPEFLRKGRFDETFFVDLPEQAERETILSIHLRRRRRDPGAFDVAALAGRAEGFSGAELEAVVVAALYRAYAAGRELLTEDIAAEIAATVPLSVARAAEVAGLRAWASTRAVEA